MLTTARPAFTQQEVERLRTAYQERFRHRPVNFLGAANIFLAQERERHFLRLLRKYAGRPLEELRILDVGCAGGYFLRSLLKYGIPAGNMVGIDIWQELLEQGRRIVPSLTLVCASGDHIPFPDASFDVVLQSTMFSSVLSDVLRAGIAREMLRVAKPDGVVFSYDFRYQRPGDHDVKAVSRRELRRLFSGARVITERSTLPPPLARFLAPRSLALCQLASSLCPFKSHYWAAVLKT